MNVIWKCKLLGPVTELDAPSGAIALKAVMPADNQPVIYLLCHREAGSAKHVIKLFGTGANIPDDAGVYVDTITVPGPTGPFVAHIFHKQLEVVLTS